MRPRSRSKPDARTRSARGRRRPWRGGAPGARVPPRTAIPSTDRGRDRRPARRSQSTARPRSRVAERIRRAVAALQVDLMRTFALERDEKVRVERDATGRVDVDLGDPSANALRIELFVQRRVE